MGHYTDDGIVHGEDLHSLVKSDSHTVRGAHLRRPVFPSEVFRLSPW